MINLFKKLKNDKQYEQTIPFNHENKPLMIAHRGLSGILSENTIPAFKLAGKHTYYGIETDLHATIDNKYVIIHDETTAKTSNTNINVEKSTYAQVKNIILNDLKTNKPDITLRIPLLEDYIKICKKYNKVCILELKSNFTETQLIDIIEIIYHLDYLDNVIFISFILNNLTTLRKLLPKQKLQYLLSDFNEQVFQTLKKYNLDLDIRYLDLTPAIAEMVKKENIQINCWTVDTIEDANRMAQLGVDYITTDILE